MVRISRCPLCVMTVFLSPCAAASEATGASDPGPAAAADAWLEDLSVSQPAADPAAVETTRPSLLNPFPDARRFGLYARFSGMVVDQQENGRLADPGGGFTEVTFERGYGLTAAVGQRLEQAPISIEVEYAYRNVAAEDFSTGMGADGDLQLHTFSANLLLDAPDLLGPLGLYAGGGVGFVISDLAIQSSGGAARVGVNGDGFIVQAMAGLTVSISRTAQLYGGVRWSDAGDVENDDFSVSAEMLAAEAGLRVFF